MKTHWLLTYVTQGGDRFQESTRAAGMEPATEADMKEGLAAVIAERARTPLPTIYVRDQLRGGQPTLVFLGRMSHVELAPDTQPGDLDAQRHLELVLTDPGQAGLDHGEPVDPIQPDLFVPAPEVSADDSPTGVLPRLEDPDLQRRRKAARGLILGDPIIPAGPDRFA